MKTDFFDAHKRHWEDAEMLFESERWANADHLFGMSFECAAKRLMHSFGMKRNENDEPKKVDDRKHADTILDCYESYRSNHAARAGYALPPSTNHPFKDWHIAQRYANQSNFNRQRVEPHRTWAEIMLKLVKKADLEGLFYEHI